MKKLFFAASLLAAFYSCGVPFRTLDYRCENLVSPLGIDTDIPHFSWKTESDDPEFCQKAYEIEVASSAELLESGKADLWKSGQMESSQQIMVRYRGQALHSREICFWRVRIYDLEGRKSKWSKPQRFSVGILEGDTMHGEYIGAFPGKGRSALLRKQFEITAVSGTALLYVNSLGYHEVYLNGERISDAVLQPAVSQLDKRALIVTYDVTQFLKEGNNDIVIWTSSGWFKPATFKAAYEGALVKAELIIDGETALCTDQSWQGSFSGYSDHGTWRAHQFGGETIDAALVPLSMNSEELDKRDWIAADTVSLDIKISQQMCEPCRIQDTIEAVSVTQESDSSFLVDFGKCLNAQLEITLPELPAGTKIPIIFQEWRMEEGRVFSFGTDTLISSGKEGGDTFSEKFNHHVFRYVLVKDITSAPISAKAYRIRTDYARNAQFECSDSDINDIEKMISYTMENLAFDGYMVDCASIERLGYGGDGNASTLSLQTVFAVSPLYRNWLKAWQDVIREDGGLPHVAPAPYSAGGGPYWCSFIVQAPWRTFISYGDYRMLKDCYPEMKKWLGYVDAWTKDGLLERWPDEDYRNWYLGDWLAPRGVDVKVQESVDLVNNCALMQCYEDLIKIASFMGKEEDLKDYVERGAALAQRINEKFYHAADSTYGTGTQLDMAYPMLTGVVPKEEYAKVEAKLIERIERIDSGHLSAGLVGVPIVTEWATLTGHADLMYNMLKKRDYPGYLYMIDNGATATWEDWAIDARSHMHNCYNGIGSWFYQALGGIIPIEPAYTKVSINPQLPYGIDWVTVSEQTPYGLLNVHATYSAIEVTIPVGITAEIRGKQYTHGTYTIESSQSYRP